MDIKHMPGIFLKLQSAGFINPTDILKTPDGFWLIYKSLSNILSKNNIIAAIFMTIGFSMPFPMGQIIHIVC